MKKILVIDDDLDLSQTIKSILEYDGYQVFVANAAEVGINSARENKPDLILLDVMMPEMDGTEAVKILKSDEGTKNIPVVFLTGLVSNQDEEKGVDGINIGGTQYRSIAKPFDNAKLLEVIREILA